MSQHYHGIGGAPGIATGLIFRYSRALPSVPLLHEDAETALAHFEEAQRIVARNLSNLAEQLRAEGKTEEAAILDAQALFAEDIAITDEVARHLREESEGLDRALQATIDQLRASFAAIDDDYLRERSADIDHIGQMIHAALHGKEPAQQLDSLPPGAILLAADLTPAETAHLRSGSVAGFATAHGGPTGHTAIMARSLGIPAVVGLGVAVLELASDTEAILDGDAALLIAHPTPDEHTIWAQRSSEQRAAQQRRQALRNKPGCLADGHRVALWANIGHPDEASPAQAQGAEGIGLFRTEYLFLSERSTPPNEDEQYEAYRRTLAAMDGRPVIVRTLDIGGDKTIPYLDLPTEANPFLGIRGLRLCMRHPHLLHTQMRALLRAAPYGDLRVMLPMVSTPDDLMWGRAQLRAAAESLAAEGVEHRADMPLGVMIETPAAAVTADLLAQEAAFFSIGSNDLTQYTMAADRGIAELTAAYPHNAPAVLRLVELAASAAHSAGIPIGVCGELAGVPEAAPLLVGLGINKLSMAPAMIPAVKEHLREMTLPQAQAAARQAMEL